MADKQKYRAAPFTLNNYTEAECDQVKALQEKVIYMIVGREVGEQGTPHLQGYLYFKNARSLSSLKKLIPRAHFSVPAKGTHLQNKTYCSKSGDLLIEFGDIPNQGARTDLSDVVNACKDGVTTIDLIEKHTMAYAKYPKFVELCKRTFAKKRDPAFPPTVKCYWGPSGAGKTRAAIEECGDDYYKKGPTTNHWFTDYDGHDKVILDELDKGYMKLGDLLEILDRYPVKVLVHHGQAQFVPSLIIATANKHPKDWYPNCSKQERKGLIRRFTEIKYFGGVEHTSDSESDEDDPIDKKKI